MWCIFLPACFWDNVSCFWDNLSHLLGIKGTSGTRGKHAGTRGKQADKADLDQGADIEQCADTGNPPGADYDNLNPKP
jgi:hypothetical protein